MKIKNKIIELNKDFKRWAGAMFFCLTKKYHLDIHVAEHCNLNCKGCTHFSPLAEEEFCDVEILKKSLTRLAPYYKVFEAIQLLGGEPLLNPELWKILKVTRQIFPLSKINLFTNGVLFQNKDFNKKIDWECLKENDITIRITQYPINLNLYCITNLCNQHGVKIEYCNNLNKHSWLKFLLYKNSNHIKAYKHKYLKLSKCSTYHCIQLVDDKLFPCPHSAYSRHLSKYFNLGWKSAPSDYLEVSNIKSIRDIRKFMITSKPFCTHCAQGYEPSKWKTTSKKRDEWLVSE